MRLTESYIYIILEQIWIDEDLMNKLTDLFKKQVVVFDGAMGTMIQRYNLTKDDFQGFECNDFLSIAKPEIIKEIHSQYLIAGAQVIETNTFNANYTSLLEYGLEKRVKEINTKAVQNAREVANAFSTHDKPRFISGSVGPGTKLPSLNHIGFNEQKYIYFVQIEALIEAGVDCLQIETNQDPLHIKAVLNAAYEVFSNKKMEIPIIIQATMQDNGQMLVGPDTMTFLQTFHQMNVDVIGINCGTGPHYMEPYVKVLSQYSNRFISLLPNAGLPIVKNGVLSYDLSPIEFSEIMANLTRKYNINIVGGCCGTNPEFIKALAEKVKDIVPQKRLIKTDNHLTSLYMTQSVNVQPKPLIIGERANTNGSKKFRKLLQEEKWEEMLEVCREQQEEGAHVLDVCLADLNRNEVEDMSVFIPKLNLNIQTPLMIDSTSYESIYKALENIGGKPIVNSINFEDGDDRVRKFVSMCHNMNASLICLAIDETGMAKDFEHKKNILIRFIDICKSLNYPNENIFFDCLTFSLATGEDSYREAGVESLKMIDYIEKNHPEINSLMGVSNVSFGLKPKVRKYLNSVFLSECIQRGLDAAIIDASKILPLANIEEQTLQFCLDLIYNKKTEDYDPLLKLAELTIEADQAEPKGNDLSVNEQLENKVIRGSLTELDNLIDILMKEYSPVEIINQILIPAMQIVGSYFESGKLQLPFVLKSAEVMRKSVDYLKPFMNEKTKESHKKMLLATVKGDVHDIGKNLVQIILENNGYQIIDIGVKQTPQQILQAIREHQPDALGLSALLIKSTEYMKETLEYLKKEKVSIPVICGGAALNGEFVKKELQSIYDGQVSFGKDAFSGLDFMKGLSL